MNATAPPVTVARPAISTAAKWYTVILLMLIMGQNQLDRGILAIVLDQLKTEMNLSDTMLGLIIGLGFGVVFALATIPLGWFADRYNRVKIIGVGVFLYSGAAIATGMAQNAAQLIAARAVLAVGEASGSAASSTIIADLFARRARARAISVWTSGTFIGLFIGFAAGGVLAHHYGWRFAVIATAIPGIIFALLLLLTVKEPARGASEEVGHVPQERATLRETVQFMRQQRGYLYLLVCFLTCAFVNYSFATWVPAVLTRVHHMGGSEVGLYSGFFKGFCGFAGILAGGFLTHVIAKGDLRRMAWVPIVSSSLVFPALMTFLFAQSQAVSLVALAVGSFLIPCFQAPTLTMLHATLQPNMRSLGTAVAFVSANLGGLGFGPLITGALSDAFHVSSGADSIRYALVLPASFSMIAMLFFILASRRIAADAERAEAATREA